MSTQFGHSLPAWYRYVLMAMLHIYGDIFHRGDPLVVLRKVCKTPILSHGLQILPGDQKMGARQYSGLQ